MIDNKEMVTSVASSNYFGDRNQNYNLQFIKRH